ncbi:transcriptional regulator [Zobellella denitrificans]|jgi:putative transcriptional regulator|uniref:XRE family transcriptional regulator n=1 Tax=Zobellella denitrificans TaxID=347534 RepID=A0A231N3G3_9GAMM|nr:helix-turn-helix transcriptional regulator [Zobellella denitrificans]ATG73326.1 XRE family transcriptional regulator [Zobellella denitrificans]OXS17031.1 transcriptional regulator [Zobellella denitrificans]
MNPDTSLVGKKIRQIREAMGLSRPKFAELLQVPPTTLKNYELGYREVGGAFLVALAQHPELHKFTLWLLSDKTMESAGQVSPEQDL